ncbi:MAG: helix-turn-helix domain-containing protein [Ruminococcaceae bacterium]|nr:helix-turn-helix domain-containing protein [Oscillospiraceae bacterium]
MNNLYTGHSLKDTIRIKKLITVYYNEFSNNYIFGGELHDFWELVYVDKGSAVITAENDDFVLSQGDIVFHKPNEFHAIKSLTDDPPNVVVLTFTTSRSSDMSFFENLITTVPIALRFHIAEILENAKNTFVLPMPQGKLVLLDKPIFGGEQMIRTHLEQFLTELVRENSANAFSAYISIDTNKTISDCISYLADNIYGNVTIDDVCAKTNYSRTYICTLFRAVTQKTIIQYYNEMKIDEAKKLIRKNKHTFAEISELLGFNTPTYFSHTFLKITNMTPSQYRKSILK